MSKFSTEVINGKVEVQKMNQVYGDAEQKYVKTVVLYGEASNNYLYTDAECTEGNELDKDTLLDLLLKGVTISYGGKYYAPLFFGEASGSVSVTFATAISASGSTAVTLYSKEYTAG